MSITNLTGTTWVFDVSKNLNHAALNGQTFEFSVNYITNGKQSDGTAVSYQGTTIKIVIDGYGRGQVHIAWANGENQQIHNGITWSWFYQKGLSITFEGGTDANNATLIAWLEDNAVRQINGILFDLSTLALSAGTHTITVKARGTGYISSPASNAVVYPDGTFKLTTAEALQFFDAETEEAFGNLTVFEYGKTYKAISNDSSKYYIRLVDGDGNIFAAANNTTATAPEEWDDSDIGNAISAIGITDKTSYGSIRTYYFRVNA